MRVRIFYYRCTTMEKHPFNWQGQENTRLWPSTSKVCSRKEDRLSWTNGLQRCHRFSPNWELMTRRLMRQSHCGRPEQSRNVGRKLSQPVPSNTERIYLTTTRAALATTKVLQIEVA